MVEQGHVAELVSAIRGLRPELDRISKALRQPVQSNQGIGFDKWSHTDWCRNALGNALIRLRLFAENNFQFIESMGVLAVARYVFELSVWLNLMEHDPRFGLIYYRELLDTQLRYYKDTLEHLRREVDLLKSVGAKDKEAHDAVLRSVLDGHSSPSEAGNLVRQAIDRVDAEASRRFSLYLDAAKTNGYDFQAYLVEQNAIPQAERAIQELENEISEFRKHVPMEVQNLVQGRWQWREMASRAGLAHEYNYIYSYASKLLHATPASLTTDQKNLELPEMCMFLRYIHVKMLDIIDLARQQPQYTQGLDA